MKERTPTGRTRFPISPSIGRVEPLPRLTPCPANTPRPLAPCVQIVQVNATSTLGVIDAVNNGYGGCIGAVVPDQEAYYTLGLADPDSAPPGHRPHPPPWCMRGGARGAPAQPACPTLRAPPPRDNRRQLLHALHRGQLDGVVLLRPRREPQQLPGPRAPPPPPPHPPLRLISSRLTGPVPSHLSSPSCAAGQRGDQRPEQPHRRGHLVRRLRGRGERRKLPAGPLRGVPGDPQLGDDQRPEQHPLAQLPADGRGVLHPGLRAVLLARHPPHRLQTRARGRPNSRRAIAFLLTARLELADPSPGHLRAPISLAGRPRSLHPATAGSRATSSAGSRRRTARAGRTRRRWRTTARWCVILFPPQTHTPPVAFSGVPSPARRVRARARDGRTRSRLIRRAACSRRRRGPRRRRRGCG